MTKYDQSKQQTFAVVLIAIFCCLTVDITAMENENKEKKDRNVKKEIVQEKTTDAYKESGANVIPDLLIMIRKMIAEEEHNKDTKHAIGLLLWEEMRDGDPQRAYEAACEVLEKSKNYDSIRGAISILGTFGKQHRKEEVLQILRKQLKRESIGIRTQIAQAFYNIGDKEGALKIYLQILGMKDIRSKLEEVPPPFDADFATSKINADYEKAVKCYRLGIILDIIRQLDRYEDFESITRIKQSIKQNNELFNIINELKDINKTNTAHYRKHVQSNMDKYEKQIK